MHRIYFEKRCIIICEPSEQALADTQLHRIPYRGAFQHPHTRGDVRGLGVPCRASTSPTEDTGWMYRKLCAEFKEGRRGPEAWSPHRRGDFLLISRNGPVGPPQGPGPLRENGEDIRLTAIREVREEDRCGPSWSSEASSAVTDHCYLRGGLWHLKHTWVVQYALHPTRWI